MSKMRDNPNLFQHKSKIERRAKKSEFAKYACRGVSKLALTFDPVRLRGKYFVLCKMFFFFSFDISLISKIQTKKVFY